MRYLAAAALLGSFLWASSATANCLHDDTYYNQSAQICVNGALWVCASGGSWSSAGVCNAPDPIDGTMHGSRLGEAPLGTLLETPIHHGRENAQSVHPTHVAR